MTHATAHVDFSVIIPTYNRPATLSACLQSLAQQDATGIAWEVIVVDDGGRRNPQSIVDPLAPELPLRLLRRAHEGPAAARNAGAAAARGTNLVFLDDDCAAPPDWLRTLARHAHEHPGRVLGGHTHNALQDNPFSEASQLLVDHLYAYYNHAPEEARFFTSGNICVPRKLFLQLGGFDTTFQQAAGEDRDLSDRLREHGATLQYVPEVVLHHTHRLTLRSFLRQHYRYGRGALLYHRLHAARRGIPLRFEPWAFYHRLLTRPFQTHTWRRSLPLALLLAAAQAANAAGFFRERVRRRGA